MRRILLSSIAFLAAISMWGQQQTAISADKYAVVHCEEPGNLTLTREAYYSPNLKIVGNIDARDFKTLKQVTINVTRTLDLSEAVIHEYTGRDGCMAPGLQPDWMVGDGEGAVTYDANMFPINAFLETRDNSLSKFYRGSYSLSKIILPVTLEGFMRESLSRNEIIMELVVPEGATHLQEENGLIYNADKTELLQVAPANYGDIVVASSVTEIAPDVFSFANPASVTFTSTTMPKFNDGNKISAAYLQAPWAEEAKEQFPDIDCFSEMQVIEVADPEPGQVLVAIGNQGFSRKDVRALKVTGDIHYEDLLQILELPNLHIADLSGANVTEREKNQMLKISNPSLTELKFPTFSIYSTSLYIERDSRLHGDLVIPQRIDWFGSQSARFTSVVFPSSIYSVEDDIFRYSTILESADFSQCTNMTYLKGFSEAGRLKSLKLPPNLTTLLYVNAPIREIEFPESLQVLNLEKCFVDSLRLPSSLQSLRISHLPFVTDIDASEATELYSIDGLDNTPDLRYLDLSGCPITSFNAFNGSEDPTSGKESRATQPDTRVVVSGGTRYPALYFPGIERIKLPSTITSFNAFENCPNLEEIDLMGCYNLERISGIESCDKLHTLSLPESVKTISGLDNNPSLSTIRCAATDAPKVDSYNPFDYSKIDLFVANGLVGAYRMAEGWEDCKSISEGGYRVSIDTGSLPSALDNTVLNITGAGLYQPDSVATLYAAPCIGFGAESWTVAGQGVVPNPCEIKVTDNIVASPNYVLTDSLCDIVFTVYAPVEQYLFLNVNTDRLRIYLNNVLTRSMGYGSPQDIQSQIKLPAGESKIHINGNSMGVTFQKIESWMNMENPYKVTSFQVNDKNSLTRLEPYNFDIDALDLSGCTSLKSIGSSYLTNRIGSLDVSGCEKLYQVYLYNASMQDFKSDGAPLEYIALSGNNLSGIDLSGMSKLERLYASNNQLTSLDLSGSTGLRELYASNNQLTSLDLSGATGLVELSLYDNQLSNLDLSGMSKLEKVSVWKNQLTSLDLSEAIELRELNAYDNQLSSLDLSGRPKLEKLSIRKNQLTSLDLSGSTGLIELFAYDNQLTSLDLSGMSKLERLYASNNQLTSLDLSGSTGLIELFAYDNQLTSLDLSGMSKLEVLSVGTNQLTSLDLSGCTGVRELSVNNNQLEGIDLSELTQLSGLWIYSNRLTSLDLTGLNELIAVNAAGNYLEDFKMTTDKCESLYLHDNRLAFSTLTPEMYDIYVKMRTEFDRDEYLISFIPDTTGLSETGYLDLSDHMFPPECDTRTRVEINGNVVEDTDGNGLFKLEQGYSDLRLYNDAYPSLAYCCYGIYSGFDHSSVSEIEDDNSNFVNVTGSTITVEAPYNIVIVNMSGQTIFQGKSGVISNLPAGIYMASGKGKTKKLMIK